MGGTLSEEIKAPYCCSQHTILYMFDSKFWNPSLDVIMAVSALIMLFIGLQITRHEHLKSHPAPLIAALCFSESWFCFLGISRYFICEGGHAEGLAAATMFWSTSYES